MADQTAIMEDLGKRTGMNYQQAIADGHSVEDVIAEMQGRLANGQQSTAMQIAPGETPTRPHPQEPLEPQFIVNDEVVPIRSNKPHTLLNDPVTDEKPKYSFLKNMGRNLIRAGLEGGGGVGGAILSAPLAPATMGTSVLAGSGLGYAAGKKLADFVLQENLPKNWSDAALGTAKDVGIGAAMEGLGQTIVPLAKFARGVMPSIKPTTKAANTLAGTLESDIGPTLYDFNAGKAQQVVDAIPGFNVSRASMSNAPDALTIERALINNADAKMSLPSGGKISVRDWWRQQTANNNRALSNHIEAASNGNVADYTDELYRQLNAADNTLTNLPQRNPIQTGKEIINSIESARLPLEGAETAAWNATPKGTMAQDALDAVRSELSSAVLPSREAQSTVKGLLKYIDTLPRTTEGIRSAEITVNNALNSTADRNIKREIMKIKDAIVQDLNALGPEFSQAKAASLAKFDRFGRGPVADITAANDEIKRLAISLDTIPQHFTTPTGAQYLKKAIGESESKQLMGDYYKGLVAEMHESGQSAKTMTAWFNRNRPVLREYGIADDVLPIVKAVREREVLGRLLKTDPDAIVPTIFSGEARNRVAAVDQVMKRISSSPEATAGLQKSFLDWFEKNALSSGSRDAAGELNFANTTKLINEYAPVFERVFKNNPAGLKAIKDVHEGIQLMQRLNTVQGTAGSQTGDILTNAGRVANMVSSGILGSALELGTKLTVGVRNNMANDYLAKAMFDPDYAKSLLALANNRKGAATTVQKLKQRMLMSYGVHKARDNE